MLDLIFISYDEPNARKNWKALKSRFPHAMRVHRVKGIANAHIAAAKLANTTFFYVVDADAEILDTFDFSYKPTKHEADYVHIWHAFNPAIGLDYGYGGVKLFSKKFFKNITSQLDFTTSLTKDVKIMDEIACITRFNSDEFRAYRGAFREAVKLYKAVNSKNKPSSERKDARDRLCAWLSPARGCQYRKHIVSAVKQAIYEAKHRNDEDIKFINDHDLLTSLFTSQYPELDIERDPTPNKSNPMRHELFFTSRIASALYDPFVLENLPITELRDAISDGQILSKLWLIENLKQLLESGKIKTVDGKARVLITGGWIGTLALMMNAWELPVSVTNIDLDWRVLKVADTLNYDFDYKSVYEDMYNVNYAEYDVIINTSSEHIKDIGAWRNLIPTGRTIIVQNNDYDTIEDHISNVYSSSELRDTLNLQQVHYEGTRKFPLYSRYMVIGTT